MPRKETLIKNATIYAVYLLLIWGFYRLLIKLPDEVEEVFIKPIIWLIPVLYFVKIEKTKLESIGITLKNLFPSLYMALGLGAIFIIEGIIANYLKYGGLKFAANIGDKVIMASLGLSFATAISEEISFRGYLFTRVWKALGNELLANILVTVVWVFIHVPVTIFVWKYKAPDALIYLALTALFGFGSSFVFARTKNILSSIFLHVLWEWPIILFR